MASEHPFQLLFETLGKVPVSHAESVNRQAYEILSDILKVPVEKSGRCILLRAPRAGHGKTHLLSRIQHQLGSDHEFIPLHAAYGCRIDSATVTDDALRRLVRQLPASGGLTILDLVTRRLFASALQPLVGSGEVPCQDREGALTALRARPIETFDFHHPNAVTAHWARENFEVLGQRLSHELAQRAGLPIREVAFWVDTLFRFASSPLENSNRVRALAESVNSGGGAELERLEALLGLLTMLTRVVLVADDLEGFSADETAALRLASFLGALRQSVERLDVILSVNKDIWESAFVPRLSGGLADRLSEIVVELEPLKEAEMAALLESRVPGLGERVLEKVDRNSAGTHARGLIQAAGMAWLKATAMDSAPAVAAPVAAASLPPVAEPIPHIDPPAPQPEPAAAAPTPVFEPVAEVAPASLFAPPTEEVSPFTIATSSPVQEFENPDAWPAPEFSPAPPVLIEPEPVYQSTPAQPSFQIEQPVASANTVPEISVTPQWQPTPREISPPVWEPAPANAWNPAAQVAVPEPPVFHPAVESPFQIAAQAPPEPPAQSFNPGEWQVNIPAAVVDPPVDSPFQIASPQTQVAQPVSGEPLFQDGPAFSPEPPQQFVPTQTYNPDAFAPPAQIDSPEPPAQSQPVVSFNPEPVFQPTADYGTQPAAPFQGSPQFVANPAPAFQPPPDSGFSRVPEPAEPTPAPSSADTDRVDDLLRQFRERYGRGSL